MALAACSGPAEPEQLRVDVPISDEHRSLIVGVELGDDLDVRALEISDARTIDPIQLRFPFAGQVAITALLYREPLAALDLEAGELIAEQDPAEEVRPLPSADQIARLTISEGATSEWVTEVQLPSALERFEIARPDPCGDPFQAQVIELGGAGEPVFALPVDARWVMVGIDARSIPSEEPSVRFVDRDGGVVRQAGLPSSFFDGYREESGVIWLGGERGVVYRATFTADPEPHLDVTASSTVTSREDIISLVGPASGTPRQQFALTTDRGVDEEWGAFEWFDGTSWSVPGLRRNTPHDATWVAPGYGLFASFYRDTLVYGAKDGVEISILVPTIVFGSVVQIDQMPGLGLVAGTSAGEVHLQRASDGAWRLIANRNIEPINGLHVYRDGLIFLNGNSMVRWIDQGPDSNGIVCSENVSGRQGSVFQSSVAVLDGDVIVPLLDQAIAWFKPVPR